MNRDHQRRLDILQYFAGWLVGGGSSLAQMITGAAAAPDSYWEDCTSKHTDC